MVQYLPSPLPSNNFGKWATRRQLSPQGEGPIEFSKRETHEGHTPTHLIPARDFRYRASVDTAWYFAYGSNMQSATLRGRRGVEYLRAQPGRAPGWRLVFDKPALLPVNEAYANIVPDAAAEVLGVLYEVRAADLEQIELTEGVLLGNYRGVEVDVFPLDDGTAPRTAFTLTSDHRDPTLRPSTRYMRLVIAGAEEHGLPPEYVDFLRAVPAQQESAEAAALRAAIDEALRGLKNG